MAKARAVSDGFNRFYGIRFNCPGCAYDNFKGAHILPVNWCPEGKEKSPDPVTHGHAHWEFNGDMDRPTFSPSILSRQDRAGVAFVCHSFIRDGMIEFLSDCTHEFAGKTIALPDLPDNAEQ